MKRLAHCPFCGEDENLTTTFGDKGSTYSYIYEAKCNRCGARGPEACSSVKQTALDAAADDWNRRITHEEDVAARIAFSLDG